MSEPRTPWSEGKGKLEPLGRQQQQLGFIPTRRQVLSGYVYAQGDVIEGQVARARRELGPAATVEQIADRIAVSPGDRDFLSVLFGTHVEIPEKEEPDGPRDDGGPARPADLDAQRAGRRARRESPAARRARRDPSGAGPSAGQLSLKEER